MLERSEFDGNQALHLAERIAFPRKTGTDGHVKAAEKMIRQLHALALAPAHRPSYARRNGLREGGSASAPRGVGGYRLWGPRLCAQTPIK